MRVRTETGTISSRLRALATDTSEICNSPGSKTPNLVARLMGLDLLPDQSNLNHSLSNLLTITYHGSSRLTSHRLSKKSTRLGTRSLPESPRVSSARKSDFDIHRLSLQLNKENNKQEEFGSLRMKRNQEENRSPRDYARQIVKQIKEKVVTRRVLGMDITNSVKNRDAVPSQELRRDTTVSCSPRTRFSDKENKPRTIHKRNSSSSVRPEQFTEKPKTTTVILVPVSKVEKQSQKRVKQRQLKPINKCNKAESETRFTQLPIKPSSPTPDTRIKQREALVDVKAKPLYNKKIKKIPNANDSDSITGPSQKQINERDRLNSNEDASICFSRMYRTEKDSSHVPRSQKLNDADTDSAVTRHRSTRCPIPEEIVSMDVDHLLGTKKKLEKEGEEIIGEIERKIMDALVEETVSQWSLNQRRRKTKSAGNGIWAFNLGLWVLSN